ncbi:MAG: arginine--tRNA ligase [Candidatus Paceibacterota bacterium]
MTNNWLIEEIVKAIKSLGLDLSEGEIKLDHPTDLVFGDFSTSVAMSLAKKSGKNPKDLAGEIKDKILAQSDSKIKDIQIAGPGFINFYLSDEFFSSSLQEILAEPETFGQNKDLAGQKVMVEYTDANPFKEFHIGHLMSNTVGETLSLLFTANGAEVKRACYQGDVGMHVAKALWGMFKLEPELPGSEASSNEKIKFLGKAYALGATEYEDGTSNAKEGIVIINKKVYKRSDPKLNELYDLGRRWSLEHFEILYKRLGTKFDFNFFESETWALGQKIVEEGLVKGIFEKSDGAVIFPGEKYDPHLHTRVFINSEGVTTYEAKDLGLARLKSEKYPFDISLSITGNEQSGYFKVLLKAIDLALPDLAGRVKHLAHGFLRLPSGKMSSRTGDVITAESLLDDVKVKVLEKIKDRDFGDEEKNEIAEKVAVGAIKYSILKQGIGKDIIFDFDKSLSFEGDSGPYLQYAYTRALSVLKKAEKSDGTNLEVKSSNEADAIAKLDFDESEIQLQQLPASVKALASLLYRLPEVTESAYQELAPQHIATYLIDVAGAFNSFYAQNQIIGSEHEASFLALVRATSIVLKNGLSLLAIPTLEKM